MTEGLQSLPPSVILKKFAVKHFCLLGRALSTQAPPGFFATCAQGQCHEVQQQQSRERKSSSKPCQGRASSVGLSFFVAPALAPVPCPTYTAALPTPAQGFCPSLTPSSLSGPPQYYSPAWQSGAQPGHHDQPCSTCLQAMGCGQKVWFTPWPTPLPRLAPQPFQSSMLLLPGCVFSHHFMQPLQQIKKTNPCPK